jgi:hypothetical protein
MARRVHNSENQIEKAFHANETISAKVHELRDKVEEVMTDLETGTYFKDELIAFLNASLKSYHLIVVNDVPVEFPNDVVSVNDQIEDSNITS